MRRLGVCGILHCSHRPRAVACSGEDGTFADRQWLHVAAVYDGTDKRIYLAGALDPATPEPKSDPIDASARAVHTGKREGEARFFDGLIDEVRICDRGLTPAEIAALAVIPPP